MNSTINLAALRASLDSLTERLARRDAATRRSLSRDLCAVRRGVAAVEAALLWQTDDDACNCLSGVYAKDASRVEVWPLPRPSTQGEDDVLAEYGQKRSRAKGNDEVASAMAGYYFAQCLVRIHAARDMLAGLPELPSFDAVLGVKFELHDVQIALVDAVSMVGEMAGLALARTPERRPTRQKGGNDA